MSNHEVLGAQLAALNALLNGTAALFLASGFIAIRRGARRLHGWLMASAFAVSTVFLISYLTRIALSGVHRYPGEGAWRTVYFLVLISHITLAVIVPPLAIRSIYLAAKRRFDEHRRWVRYTWPIWMYVSVTGVLVYALLYHPPG